ncbi:2-keto-4-pentenoate hydratase [Pseudomonas frederiksbergensis]|uniref:2-keto-4-pentenoate hydratase n=1 Tax=Pseudomonas frederiksbergensis TaxID=104087 RepID=UPI003D254BDD
MHAKFEQLAQSLATAWNQGTAITLPDSNVAPGSRAEAFAIQDRMAEILGEPCVGWKVGAAVPAVQVMEGHDGPIPGRLLANRHHRTPAQLPWEPFEGYKIECEFAFRFSARVAAREQPYSEAELKPLLVLHPGLEVAGHRYALNGPGRKATTYDLIADNGACGAYIEAPGIERWQALHLANVPIDARIDGGAPIQVFSGEYYRDPLDILVETVNDLSRRGIDLQPGDLITTGSLTLPMVMTKGQIFVARFGDLATVQLNFV